MRSGRPDVVGADVGVSETAMDEMVADAESMTGTPRLTGNGSLQTGTRRSS